MDNMEVQPAVPVSVTPTAPVAPAQEPAPIAEPAADPVAPQASEVRQVPLSALEKVRDEVQAAKSASQQLEQQNRFLTEQLALYRANAPQSMQQGAGFTPQQSATPSYVMPQSAPQATPLAAFLEGVADDGLVEAGQVRAALEKYNGYVQQQVAQAIEGVKTTLVPELTQLRLAQEIPNYKQLIEEHLPPMISADPGLAQTIKQSPNPLMTAVKFAKMRADLMLSAQAPANPNPASPVNVLDEINRIIANQAKPGNPGLSGGAINPSVSAASAIATMPEKDFKAMVEEVKRGKKFF